MAWLCQNALVVGRDEGGVGQAGAANPVLADAELARLLVLAARAAQQDGVGLPEQPVGQRQVAQLGDGVVDRVDVVAHLAPVVALFRLDLFFRQHGFVDAGLGAFDAAGGLGFLDHVHFDEQVDVRHDQRERIELPQGAVGRFQQHVNLRVFPVPVVVDRCRLEALVLQPLLPAAGFEGFKFHVPAPARVSILLNSASTFCAKSSCIWNTSVNSAKAQRP